MLRIQIAFGVSALVLSAACVGGPGSIPSDDLPEVTNDTASRGASNNDNNKATSTTTAAAPPATPPAVVNVQASSFGQACTQDSDCTAVFEGNICGDANQCPNAAIAQTAKAGYDAATNAQRAALCPTVKPTTNNCPTINVGCDANSKKCVKK